MRNQQLQRPGSQEEQAKDERQQQGDGRQLLPTDGVEQRHERVERRQHLSR